MHIAACGCKNTFLLSLIFFLQVSPLIHLNLQILKRLISLINTNAYDLGTLAMNRKILRADTSSKSSSFLLIFTDGSFFVFKFPTFCYTLYTLYPYPITNCWTIQLLSQRMIWWAEAMMTCLTMMMK